MYRLSYISITLPDPWCKQYHNQGADHCEWRTYLHKIRKLVTPRTVNQQITMMPNGG